MITLEKLVSIEKSDLPEVSKALLIDDLPQLVEWLGEKDDKIRYNAFLLLEDRSLFSSDVYMFWDNFREKLKSENSYQRSIGLMLLADNARWDTENKFDLALDDYLALINDEKPITVRQCIQALLKIIPYKKPLHLKIAQQLMALDISKIKETMQKLILIDILNALTEIRKYQTTDGIDSYIVKAISGGKLDSKTKKHFEALF